MVGLNIKNNTTIEDIAVKKNIFIFIFTSIKIPTINTNIIINRKAALSPERKINNALDITNNKLK